MKLLLDENLSRRLVPFLQEAYPDTTQVSLLGLEQSSDRQLCESIASWHFSIPPKEFTFIRHEFMGTMPS